MSQEKETIKKLISELVQKENVDYSFVSTLLERLKDYDSLSTGNLNASSSKEVISAPQIESEVLMDTSNDISPLSGILSKITAKVVYKNDSSVTLRTSDDFGCVIVKKAWTDSSPSKRFKELCLGQTDTFFMKNSIEVTKAIILNAWVDRIYYKNESYFARIKWRNSYGLVPLKGILNNALLNPYYQSEPCDEKGSWDVSEKFTLQILPFFLKNHWDLEARKQTGPLMGRIVNKSPYFYTVDFLDGRGLSINSSYWVMGDLNVGYEGLINLHERLYPELSQIVTARVVMNDSKVVLETPCGEKKVVYRNGILNPHDLDNSSYQDILVLDSFISGRHAV